MHFEVFFSLGLVKYLSLQSGYWRKENIKMYYGAHFKSRYTREFLGMSSRITLKHVDLCSLLYKMVDMPFLKEKNKNIWERMHSLLA